MAKTKTTKKSAVKRKQACNCVQLVNKELEKYNTQVEQGMQLDGTLTPPYVMTSKIDSKQRTKPKKVIATFCPFCGIRWPTQE